MGLGRIVSYLSDLLYPTLCTLCEAPVKSPPLCENCNADLHRLESRPGCTRCSHPLPPGASRCPRCNGRGLVRLNRIVSLAAFHDPLRGLVHRLKYRDGWPLAEFLADRLADLPRVQELLAETDVLVPIPLHPARQMSRGYNQAHVLAERVGNRLGVPRLTPIIRLRNTETQTHLHSNLVRMQNLRGAFGLVDERELAGKRITLVDDVLTTGATLISAARTLSQASPARINALVIAIADPRGRSLETA